MENISRRQYLKLIGSLGGIILLNGLTGCAHEEKNNEDTIEYDENGTKNDYWETTGNSKQFDVGEHFIYTIVSIYYKDNGQIIVPEGYEYISSEPITQRVGYGSGTYAIKYNFINTVPVTAKEYKNSETEEIAYPYSGTPITLEETSSKQKTLN